MMPEPLGEWDAHIPTLAVFVGDLLGNDESTCMKNLRRQLGAAAAQ